GKSRTPRLLDVVRGGNLVDRLLRLSGSIDIYVVSAERASGKSSARLEWQPPEASSAREYIEVAGVLGALTALSWFLVPYAGYLAVGLLFLLATIALSLRVGRWPVLVAGIASALLWNFLFIPPL